MPLTNAGRDYITGKISGTLAEALFDAANTNIGVGDSTTAFAATQTDLLGTNKFRKPVDAGYPTRTGNALKYQATFAGADANFAWQEWGLFNAATAGTMLDRMVEYNGTKLAGQTWIFEIDLTINIG